MKVKHHEFEQMLNAKSLTKKSFSNYAQIPYYTVAGWKKSGEVPSYAMVILKNITTPKMVTAKQLIDIGIPRAIFWNNDLTKKVPSDIFIISTLTRSYNDFIIKKFINFFGEENILNAIIKHKERISNKLMNNILNNINTSLMTAND